MRATRALIYLNNLGKNLDAVREKTGAHPEICFSIKADAYGHGAVPMARFALDNGAKSLAVAAVSEGAELRQAGIKSRILLLSQALPGEIREIADLDLVPLISDREIISALAAASKPLEVHLKIDTGMGRLGCRPEEAAELAAFIVKTKNLKLGGVATHLSVADSTEPSDIAYTAEQIALFRRTADSIRGAGIDPGQLHAANSGAVCFHDNSFFDMVRPGLLLYGYPPCVIRPDRFPVMDLKPVMELRSAVVLIRRARAGEEISYGRTWKAPEDTFVGNISMGYADGLPRLLSNRYSVQINGKPYPVIGNICMDQFMVNLGSSGEVKRWDEAIIFGPGFSTAEDIAKKTGTISYEILCNINKRVPRVYVKL